MKVVCASCHRDCGEKMGPDSLITHTVCPECMAKLYPEFYKPCPDCEGRGVDGDAYGKAVVCPLCEGRKTVKVNEKGGVVCE